MKSEKVITDFENLQNAIDEKKNDINLMTWRLKDGRNVRLARISKSIYTYYRYVI